MSTPVRYWRLFCYSLPGIPLAALGLPFYIYAPLWLAEQGGYGYSLVGLIFFVARIGDVLSDLPVGVWVDRRGSHRWFWLSAWGTVALSVMLLTLIPHPWSPLMLGLVLVLLMLGWTGITVPWLALPVNLSRHNIDRLRYNSSREAMLLIGTLAAMLVPAMVPASALPPILVLLLLVLVIAVYLQGSQKPLGASDNSLSYKILLSDPRVRNLALPWFLNMLANAIPGTVLILFMREVLHAESELPLVLICYFAAGLVGVPFWYFLANRIGNLQAWRIGLCSSALLFSLAAFLGDGDVYWFVVISIGTGLALGADQALPSVMQTGLAQTLSAERGGADVAARMFALWSMLSKAAMGVAVGVSYLWLGNQLDALIPPAWAISSVYILAPVILKLLVFVLLGRQSIALAHEEVK
ncbi:Uncharacterised protein [Zhongshania aliphaticivorans]|uniref:MFS transporter n=1 Tax=Zhongshania aliphaticivorans TaxID=1470434 RepID=A0A5S9Q8B3_9GAMM|nr:MFS transporter [Zhongshania aliphaticivorans]CAA0103379.1 Uncharacterised protein [Zhongshania aliphaticivorans]CAA0113550.1 Uncharacterised protein [Zhongshania aliphaticivorans]